MITITRPVRRLTAVYDRGRQVVIELHPPGHAVRIRCKGERIAYTVPIAIILREGARIRAAEIKAARLAARKARKADR